ncbi:MAG: HD domain-containing protein [Eubacteriales bacterium]|nr:HD domain-containing protein [Eubacteriales bacterium]
MANLFGAIDVGSHEMELKVFELSRKGGIRQVDDIVHLIDLGTDTYNDGRIGFAHVAEVKRILLDFKKTMNMYGIRDYRAYATSAFRDMENASLVLQQIEQETGIRIEILANSEQRFLDYKSIASRGEAFSRVISKSTAIVDVGGGSIQISLFEKDRLVLTQNLQLGVLRIQEQLHRIGAGSRKTRTLVEEMVNSQLYVFEKLYLEGRKIRNLIVVDDYISEVVSGIRYGFQTKAPETPETVRDTGTIRDTGTSVSAEEFHRFMNNLETNSRTELAQQLGLEDDNVPLLQISAIIVRCIADRTGAELLWFPCVTLCDGIVYEFAEERRYLRSAHDFEQDILACADQISRRYRGSEERSGTIGGIALRIFESTKKLHGMGGREKLLLQLAATLHDCGKYISMTNLAQCGYNIIKSTEIIGISQVEQEIVANVVRFNHEQFAFKKLMSEESALDEASCMTIARLTAILRVANALDRSHRRKFSDLQIRNQDRKMIITVETPADISLEKGLFGERAEFFEEVFGLRPVIKQKK